MIRLGISGSTRTEHQWAMGLRDAIVRAGGVSLAVEWIHPVDLVAVGLAAADEADAG